MSPSPPSTIGGAARCLLTVPGTRSCGRPLLGPDVGAVVIGVGEGRGAGAAEGGGVGDAGGRGAGVADGRGAGAAEGGGGAVD